MTSENTARINAVGNFWIDSGIDGEGVELNEEWKEIFREVGGEPDLRITGQSMTFHGVV
jgi:hypothetical protein